MLAAHCSAPHFLNKQRREKNTNITKVQKIGLFISRRILMPYPITSSQPSSEIKLFYQVYSGHSSQSSKPKDAVLFDTNLTEKYSEDVIEDLVEKGLWNDTLETQLNNKELYFKIFRDDEDMIPASAIAFENIRLLPNQGLSGLEEPLKGVINNSFDWFKSFIPESVRQSAYSFSEQVKQWTEDKLMGLSVYSSIPKVEQIDEEIWQEIKKESELLHFTHDNVEENTDQTIVATPTFYLDSILTAGWNTITYVANNPLKTLVLALAASSVASRIHLPKIKFENYYSPLTDGFSTATGILTKLAVVQVASRGQLHTPLNVIIAGIPLGIFPNIEVSASPLEEFRLDDPLSAGSGYGPSVAVLPSGEFVATWDRNAQDGSGYGLAARRFDSQGGRLGTEFSVNTYTTGDQLAPKIAAQPNGNFVIAWYDAAQDGSFQGVYAQRFNATGSKLGNEFRVNTGTYGSQIMGYGMPIAILNSGGFIITYGSYQCNCANTADVYEKIYDINGVAGTELLVNSYQAGDQILSTVAKLVNGNIVVAWQSSPQDGSGWGIYGQRIDTSGSVIGSFFQINTYTTNDQQNVAVASLSSGDFVTVWQSNGQDGSGLGVFGQLFSETATKKGTEFQVNTYTTGDQYYPAVISLPGGQFFVTWNSDQDGDGLGVIGQFYNKDGVKIGKEFIVNYNVTYGQIRGDSAVLSNTSIVTTWRSGVIDQNFGRIIKTTLSVNNISSIVPYTEDSSYLIAKNITINPLLFDPLVNTTFRLSDSTAGILSTAIINNTTSQYNSSTGVWQVLSNIGNANLFFSTMQFIPSLNFNKDFVIDARVSGAAGSDVVWTIMMQGIPINDPPVLIGSGGSFAFTEKSLPFVIDPNITLSDVDSLNMTNATIAITINFAGVEDVLVFVDQAGISGSYNTATGQLFLSGSSNITNYQLALRNVTFSDTSSNPSLLPRTISFAVNDGALNSNIVTRIINITPVNDAPVLVGSGGAIITFTEKTSGAAIDPNITLIDVDSPNIANATIAITGNFTSGEDILRFVNQAGITGIYSNNTGVLFLTGLSNIANYQIALRNVTYLDTSNNPSLSLRSISFTVNDGGLNSNTVFRIVNIFPVNDAPTLSGSGGTLSFTEKNPATIIDTGIIVFDVDSSNLSNATIKFTSSVLPEDVLGFTTQAGISGMYSNTTGILFLTGSATVSNYQSALRSVTYFNPSLNPSNALRTVSFAVNDGELNSNAITRSISVTPVNDPPVLAVNTLTITGGQALNFTSMQLYAVDPDTSDSALTFTLSAVQFCRFERTNAAGISIITFTQQDISNNQVRIVPTGGIISAPAYQVSVSDGQYSTTPASASVNFNGGFVPSISMNKLTITQGGVVIFTTNQLNAFDADTSASSLTFTASNIRYGTFSIVGSPANAITSFTLQSVLNGFIQFTQDGSENAPSYDISVSDGTHATNTQAAVITYININQAPVVLNIIPDRLSEKVSQAFLFQIAANTFFDSDPGDQQLLVYSAKMQNGNVLPEWISFDSGNRQFAGKPLAAGKTAISVIARDPSNAMGIANFTMDVIAALSQTSQVANPSEDNTVRNALIGAGVSALIGFIAFALKYGIKRAVNKKLQTALETNQTDTEKKQKEYDREVITPIAHHINDHLKVTAPFESISTEKVKNFVSAVRILVSELGVLGILYQDLNQADRNIVHTTIVRELKRIAHPADEDCCSSLLRCGFFKADITPQQIEDNVATIAKAVNKSLNRSKFNAVARVSDPSNIQASSQLELTLLSPAMPPTSPKPEAPRVSTILPKLAKAEEKANRLELEMTEMKKQVAMLLSAQSTTPVTIPETQPTSTPSLSM